MKISLVFPKLGLLSFLEMVSALPTLCSRTSQGYSFRSGTDEFAHRCDHVQR